MVSVNAEFANLSNWIIEHICFPFRKEINHTPMEFNAGDLTGTGLVARSPVPVGETCIPYPS